MQSYDKLIPVFNPLHLEEQGFAVVSQCLTEQTVELLRLELGNTKYAQRNLLRVAIVREVASSEPIKQPIRAVLRQRMFCGTRHPV